MGREKFNRKGAVSFRLVYRSQSQFAGDPSATDRVLQPIASKQQTKDDDEQNQNPDDNGGEFEDADDYDGSEQRHARDPKFDDADDEDVDDEADEEDDSIPSAKKLKDEETDDDYHREDYEYSEFGVDGYDYSQHLMPSGGGMFIPANYSVLEEWERKQIERRQRGAEAEADEGPVDKDILNALGAAEGQIDELDDDFVLQAMGDVTPATNKQLKRTRKTFENMNFKESMDNRLADFDDEPEEPIRPTGNDHLDVFNSKFDVLLKQYDDEDIGELADNDPSVQGGCEVEAFIGIIQEFYDSNCKRRPEQPKVNKDVKEPEPSAQVEAGEEDLDEDEDEDKLDAELITKYYLNNWVEENWDCESILTTYSNLENHPSLIIEESQNKIKLSKKTGIPIGVLPTKSKQKQENEAVPVENYGTAREKTETAEEKRERKRLVKEERKSSRERKKHLKIAYKTEELKQTAAAVGSGALQRVVVKYGH